MEFELLTYFSDKLSTDKWKGNNVYKVVPRINLAKTTDYYDSGPEFEA